MEMNFIKSAAILAILLLFYKLLLEKENMHVFKRFYLLGLPLISFGIPLISFPEYIAVSSEGLAPFSMSAIPETAPDFPLFEVVLSSIYVLGVLFFGSRFFINLKSLLKRAKTNPTIKTSEAVQVLVKEEVTPHTFWSYIYLNRQKFKEKQIPQEVLEHELAHVRQKHTADILLMEVLQVLLWFLPLIYLLKKAVKLNHEFLADSAVLEKADNIGLYQQILLSFSSGEQNDLVNSINYQSIKKRFTVMKKQPSQKAILVRYVLFLPLLAGLLYSFSSTETIIIQENSEATESVQEKATPEMIREYNTMVQKLNEKGIIKQKDLSRLYEILPLMTAEQKKNAVQPIYRIVPPNESADWDQTDQFNKMTDPHKATTEHEKAIKQELQKLNGLKVRYIDADGEQEKATSEMVKEYNKLTRYYRDQQITEATVEEKGFKRMRYIFSIMTEEQRKGAEKLPPPPPPTRTSNEVPPVPPAPKTTNAATPPPPPPPAPPVSKEGTVPVPPAPPVVENAENVPLPPPPPPSPIEAVKQWMEEGAEFYLNGKKVSGEIALEAVKENNGKNMSVEVKEDASGKTVKISDNKR